MTMISTTRYAISDTAADWSSAEAQVARLGKGQAKSSVVSVKTASNAAPGAGQKRKAGDEGEGEKKKTRRGSGKKAKQ